MNEQQIKKYLEDVQNVVLFFKNLKVGEKDLMKFSGSAFEVKRLD